LNRSLGEPTFRRRFHSKFVDRLILQTRLEHSKVRATKIKISGYLVEADIYQLPQKIQMRGISGAATDSESKATHVMGEPSLIRPFFQR
jgi:hypothetical protein